MCDFCDDKRCMLTKEQVLKRGAILELNARNQMRTESEELPATYSFKGVPCYNSLSALIPDEDEESPHEYLRFSFDEDEDCDGDWESWFIQNPMEFQTEKEFLEKLN